MTPRLELEEWFFFYGVYVMGDDLAVNKGIERAALVFAHTADASFSIGNFAMMAAEKAVDIIFIGLAV